MTDIKMNNSIYSLTEYKKFVADFDDDQIDIYGQDYSSCWLYAYYVHLVLSLPITQGGEPLYENKGIPEFKNDGL